MNLLIKVAALLFTFNTCIQIASGSYGTQNPLLVDSAITEKSIAQKLQLVNEYKNSDIKQAMDYARQALADAENINSRKCIAESKLAIGSCYDYLGSNPDALEHLKQALLIFDELNDQQKKASTLFQIGNIYYNSFEYLLALDYYEDVFTYAEIVNDTLLMIQGDIGKGSVYGNTNRLDSAMLFFKKAFSLAREFGDQATEVQSLLFMGEVNLFSNRILPAIEIYNDVEKQYDLEKVNSKLLAGLYNSITHANLRVNDIGMAKIYSRKAFAALKKYSRQIPKMNYYILKFRIDTLEKNYKSAVYDYMSYKLISDSINNSEIKKNLTNYEAIYELKRKEDEISRLTNENKLKDLSIRQKNIVNFGSITLVVLLFIIIFQSLRAGSKIREKNRTLQSQGDELTAANEELNAINEELIRRSEELEVTLSKLQNTQKQLVQSEKMASLGMLASGVAHEINNSLNYIKGGVRGIFEQLKKNQNCRESDIEFLVYAVNSGIEKAVAVVSGLGHFSRNENSAITELDIHKVIDTCLEMLKYMTHNKIEIIKEYSDKCCIVTCNEGKLHQALMNILINAIQAIDGSGTISIKTEQGNGKVKTYFNDTGCGINENDMNKILEPFFTTRDPGEGVGLGLSITYSILEEQNGSIDFKSVNGKGTTVIVTLPCHN